MPRGSHAPRIEHSPIKMLQFTGEAYSEGIESQLRDKVALRVYSVAKTVVVPLNGSRLSRAPR